MMLGIVRNPSSFLITVPTVTIRWLGHTESGFNVCSVRIELKIVSIYYFFPSTSAGTYTHNEALIKKDILLKEKSR